MGRSRRITSFVCVCGPSSFVFSMSHGDPTRDMPGSLIHPQKRAEGSQPYTIHAMSGGSDLQIAMALPVMSGQARVLLLGLHNQSMASWQPQRSE